MMLATTAVRADGGEAGSFPALFDLSSLDGTNGFALYGVHDGDASGRAVRSAGDVNGDGIADLLIGAPKADPNGKDYAGESYVVFGQPGFPAAFDLRSLYPQEGGDGSAGFVLKGVGARDESGVAVSAAGDVNGDGVADLLIGARRADQRGKSLAGESYVVFGRTTGFPATFELGSLFPQAGGDGSAGFVLNGVTGGDFSGHAVAGAGDVNGDGIADLLIGAFDAASNGNVDAGASYVVFGRAKGFPAAFELRSLHPEAGGDGSAGFVLKGIDTYDRSGIAVSGAGDANGDGVDDLLIGAYGADSNDRDDSGETYVVFGRATGFPAAFELRSLHPRAGGDGNAGFILKGIDADDFSGSSVSNAGDVNGDGIGDVIVGAYGADFDNRASAGESYVVFGRATDFPAAFELRNLQPVMGGDGTAGFILKGIDTGDLSGCSVSAAGDVNDDGIEDLVIGAWRASPNGRRNVGEAYVVFGRATGFAATFELRSLYPQAGGDGSAGFVLKGIGAEDATGVSVSNAGDVNGDGIDDVLVGAGNASVDDRHVAGKSYVVFGRAAPVRGSAAAARR